MNEQARYAKQWKLFLVLLALLALTLDAWSAFYWKRGTLPEASGTLAAEFGPAFDDYRRPILKIASDSPLSKAGAKVGDSIKYDAPADRYRHLGVDDEVGVRVFSGDKVTHVLLKPIPDPNVAKHPTVALITSMLGWLSTCAALIIAMLIGIRRAESVTMRMFSLALMAVCFDDPLLQLPSTALGGVPVLVFYPLAFSIIYVGFAFVTLSLAEGGSHWRHAWIRRTFWTYVGVFCLFTVANIAARNTFDLPHLHLYTVNITGWSRFLAIISSIASLVALRVSWRVNTGTMRQRLAWIGVCMGAIYLSYFLLNLNGVLGFPVPSYLVGIIQTGLIFPALCGLGYASLRHRLFDFGFAVNRALVVTALSGILLLAFGLTEFTVDKLLHFEGREKNVIFDAVVALGIFLSFHRIQHWVNHKVDHIFFHGWYEAAEKMRRFLDKAPYISSAAVLQEKFVSEVDVFSGTSGSAIYLKQPDATYQRSHGTLLAAPVNIDADNDAVIEVAHSRKAVYLSDSAHALPGELVLPMTVRGELNGLLLVGQKSNGQNFRVDEVGLLMTAVHQIALDLEGLRVLALEQDLRDVNHELSIANAKTAIAERIVASFREEFIAQAR